MTALTFKKTPAPSHPAVLVLADGTFFEGRAIGKKEMETTGEVVFQTSMTGYPELLTDPSYQGQMLTFTYPEIGNYGVAPMDFESKKIHAKALITRHFSNIDANWRSELSLEEWLIQENVAGITDIDTRALVLHLRTQGSTMGVLSTQTDYDVKALWEKAKALTSMAGQDLAQVVSSSEPYEYSEGLLELNGTPVAAKQKQIKHVVAIDYGIKTNILRLLVHHGCRVTVVPAKTTAKDILALKPDGIFLSNGPGDPASMPYAVECVRELVGKVPLFGICMGHQILSQALGGKTFKMLFGHRGANQPVKHGERVLITSQNHGFVLDKDSLDLPGVEHSQTNISDETSEGITLWRKYAFSVQYHPEGAPGPHDAFDHFGRFVELMETFQQKQTSEISEVSRISAS
jgi:carbamoyl-phosphate synthase small subunit